MEPLRKEFGWSSSAVGAAFTFLTIATTPPVAPETLDAFETGLKTQFWEDRARFDASVNAQATWASPNDRYDVRIFANNLLDKHYYTSLTYTGGDIYTATAPRTFGVNFGVHF